MTRTVSRRARDAGDQPFRALALLSVLVLVGSYVSILYEIVNVVGGVTRLTVVLAFAVAASTVMSRLLGLRSALTLSGVLLVAGLGGYLASVSSVYLAFAAVSHLVKDTIAFLTGLSVLRMMNVSTWVLGIAPGPVFLTWYLALRRQYVYAVVVSGLLLGFFVLSGDAGHIVTLTGVVAAAGTLGFGALDRHGGTWEQADVLAVVLVSMIVVSTAASAAPVSETSPVVPQRQGSGSTTTIEQTVAATNERITVQGSIDLSPKVRFTVTADEPAYWRTAAYDRYTGGDWIRTGKERDYDGSLAPPSGPSKTVEQTITVETRIGSLPAAWRPVQVDGIEDRTEVTGMGDLQVKGALTEGDTYTVRSQVPNANEEQLQSAGTDYPDRIRERYLQLPESSPDRVGERTAAITEEAETPYESAVLVERWLQTNKRYSLDVERPDGDIADAFLFEMQEGYCVYYATTMTAMLRSQGIPARFVVGYTSGQRVGENEWVVRGLDSHAWVEVYFPDVGWIAFDPTPGSSRSDTRSAYIDQARAAGVDNVDTNETEDGVWTPEPDEETETETTNGTENGTDSEINPHGERIRDKLDPTVDSPDVDDPAAENPDAGPGDGGGWPSLPPTEQLMFGLLIAVGVTAGAHRRGVFDRTSRELGVRWQWPQGSPRADAREAYERLEYVLERRFSPREVGETPRQYVSRVAAGDERVRRVAAVYEQAQYAGVVSSDDAADAVTLVDEIVDERRPFQARIRALVKRW